MFFPRKFGLRRNAPKPKLHLNPNDELRPELKLSRLELMALLLIR
ncbi:MAG TPA: hypothetical protein VGV07_27075 [Devosia sp.]|nr:hypothetical protein [Devosia sp.]HEV2518940.1 hypothetical protein [Devosia sp.]